MTHLRKSLAPFDLSLDYNPASNTIIGLSQVLFAEAGCPVAEVGNGTHRAMNLPGYRWVVLGLAIGISAGVGACAFAYAKGWSYLTESLSSEP